LSVEILALELVGERWTLLVIRDAFLGKRRFEELQQSLGISRNVLTDRLGRLVESGIFERVRYQERPERHEYVLTDKGRELRTALLALMLLGRSAPRDGRPAAARRARQLRGRGRRAARLQRVRLGARSWRGSPAPRPGRAARGRLLTAT
jgi:DNA-binding HxlR family transcriptional regulator